MDKLISIYRLVGGVETMICTISKENASLSQSIMDKDKVTLSVVTEDPLYLAEGDYILLDGVKYRINRDPEDKQSSEKEHSYDISFEAPIYTLIDKIYSNKITGSTTVTLTGKLRDFLELLIWNINYDVVSNPLGVDTGWEIGLCPDTDYMNLTLETTKCRDALDSFASKFGLEYYVSNKTINFVSHIENETGLVFTQGEGKGLYEVERKNVDDGDLVTRVYVKGGTENITPGEGDSNGRLMLPEGYIENFSESQRGVEAVVVFDSIHPTFQGSVGNVSGDNNREFLCPEVDFDIADVAVGDDARVNFLTGDLMGKSFEFKWDNSLKKITLIYQEDDLAAIDPNTGSRPNIPSSSKYLRGGELFNFTGLKLSGTYKTNAITKLREKGADWLAYYCRKRVKFELNVDYRYLRKHNTELHCGDLITINVPLHNISKLIRVTAIERNLYTGKLTCTVSNYLDEKWKDKIEDQIAEIKTSTATINGGYGGATVTILENNDEREPSDSNVFSALRSLKEIIERALSRKNDDSAAGLITFIKGLVSEKIITAKEGVLFGNFLTGETGAKLDANGDAEVRNIIARIKAKVVDLEVTNTAKAKAVTVSDKVTTLNLLVKDLADVYNLDVSNVATLFRTIIKDYVSSETFIAGLAGEGFKLYKALSGDWNLELDNLTIRKAMTIFELIISKIRAVNGGLVVSQANGRVKSVNEDTTNYVLGIEGNMTFESDDFVRCQVFGTIGAKYYWVRVVSVSGDSITIPKSEFPEGTVPAVGDDLVQMGNKTNTARQGILYLTASEDGKPRFSVLDGVNSTDLTGKNKLILGCLDGITDSDFPSDAQPSGYGLWAVNVFLKGLFILRNGKSVEDELSDQITAVRTAFEIREGQISSKVTEATTAATNAGNSAILAQGSASTASTKAGEASTSATNAKTSETNASGSASTAGSKATAAASSASAAANSATSAAGSASDAANILTEVTEKKSSIDQTASNITLQVSEVTTKTTQAATSATNAANSASSAAGSASTATSKATAAATAADTASSKASAASGSAGAAATSAFNAAGSATSAAGSASAASNVLTAVTTKQSEINQTASNITLQVTEVTTKTVQATNAAELATAMSKGKMLYRDPTFVSGLNGISVYNNTGNGLVTHARVSGISGNPNGSGYCIKITTFGSALPGWGGFYFGTQTKANQVLLVRFVANIPSGYTVEFSSNATGSGGAQNWLTDHAGTGKWEEYAFKVVCGSTGSFSSTNFFYLSGGSTPTASAPLIWYVCYATVFDMTDVDDIPTRTEASNDAASKANAAQSTAIGAAASDATNKANTAQNNAISAAATDATSKANAAENNAKTYSNNTFATKTEFSSQLTILNNSISSKVSQTDFNALGSRVSSAETTISQHTNQIALKASQSDLTALGTRVSSAEAKITPDAINLTVKSQTQTIAQQAADEIQIGGRNLINGTSNGYGWSNASPNGSEFHCTASSTGESAYIQSPLFGLKPNQNYVLSFESKEDAKINGRDLFILSNNYQTNGAIRSWTFAKGTNWHQTVIFFTTNASFDGVTDLRLRIDHNGSSDGTSATIYIRNIKLELGTKATDFTSSPEDVDASIALRPTSDEIKSQFTMDQTGISMLGKKIALTGLITFSSFDSSTQSTINGKATTGYVDSAKSSAISTAATDATTKANTAQNNAVSAAATDAATKANNALASAKSYSDTLKNSLGSLAYDNAVSLAKLDTTVVEGGYIKTSLINASAIVTGALLANVISATDITTGKLTVTDGAKIGDFYVTGNYIRGVASNTSWVELHKDFIGLYNWQSSAQTLQLKEVTQTDQTGVYWDTFNLVTTQAIDCRALFVKNYMAIGNDLTLGGSIKGFAPNTTRTAATTINMTVESNWITATASAVVRLPPSPKTGHFCFVNRGAHALVTVYGNGHDICRTATSTLGSIPINTDGQTWIFVFDGTYWIAGYLNN